MSMSAYGAVPQESDWAKRVQAMEERLRRNEMEMARMRGAKGETREWQEKRRASDNDQENGEKLIKRSRSV
ncbi:hypothetical protein CI109_103234 [Kwoniella shandongensis]|uniref:Uncharacterized protein n=1 Tax=Kwoniella shandongensis TaxID=1734106 RepID=A0A5M6C9G3_9TREE|nr:uncharacterized protein CI109_000424 [Kwoniella shandongensis]KAA5531581.1 hypothetical protein CI109_000424 [Kwoniella shandongensis]